MPLKEPYMVKRFTASEGGQLTADPGLSLLIKDIYCLPSTNDDFLTVTVDLVLCAFYRVQGFAGNHQAYPNERKPNPTLMGYLAAKGVNPFIPVAEGQTINVKRYAEAGDVTLVYEIHDAGDITPDMPNGSTAKEYVFINYATNLAAIAVEGEFLLDKILVPAEFPDFPVEKDVPAKTRISMLGVVGSPLGYDAAPSSGETQYLKFVRGRDTLHDEDRHGIMFEGEDLASPGTSYIPVASAIGALTDTRTEEPLWFPEPLIFEPGEELNPYVTIKGVQDAGIPADKLDVAFILRVVGLE